MKIMKTNLLVLDNKIRKDDSNSTITIEAPVPSSTDSQSGMKALMFQGMKNLMDDPNLAQEIGLKNEEPKANDESAKSYVAPYSSNLAFGKNFKNVAKAVAMSALILAAAPTLTSCEKHNDPPKITIINTVTNEGTLQAIQVMQTILMQMLAEQKITNEQFAEYMKKTDEWRQQTSEQIAGLQNQINGLYAVLFNMGEYIIDVKNGIDENNGYQKMVLALLEQYGYSQSDAIALLQQAIDIAKQNGKTVADGMAYIISGLNDIHQDLTTIIAKLDNAAKQRQEQTNILYGIQATGMATKEQIEVLNNSVIETNNILKEQGNKFLEQLAKLGSDVTDAIGELARQNNCTRQDILRGLAAIGVKIDANTTAQYMTSGILSAQLQAALAKLDKMNKDINIAKDEFKNDAAGYASRVIEILEEIEAELSAFVGEWTQSRDILFAKIDNLTNYANKIYQEEKYQSGMMDKLHQDFIDIKKQMNADHILLEKVYNQIQSGNSISKEDIEAIALRLGNSVNLSLDEIAGLIRQELENDKVREQQLDALDAKMGGLATLSQEILDALKDLDVHNANALSALGKKLDALKTALDNLAGKVDGYAKTALEKYSSIENILTGVAGNIDLIKTDISSLKLEVQKANNQLSSLNTYLSLVKNTVEQIEQKMQRPITPEELDSIMTKHDKDNQNYYTPLLQKTQINPKDYTSALDYIADLIKLLVTGQGQTNQYLLDLLAWAEQHPDRTDEIIEAIKNKEFKVIVECDCDCDKNKEIHEGVVTVIE